MKSSYFQQHIVHPSISKYVFKPICESPNEFESFSVRPDIARMGDIDLYSSEDDEFAQQRKIVKIIRHPQHRFSSKYFDIALMHLDEKIRYQTSIHSYQTKYMTFIPNRAIVLLLLFVRHVCGLRTQYNSQFWKRLDGGE